MFKKIIISLIFITSFFSVQAQDKGMLIGEWIFKEVFNKDRIKPESLAQINTQLVNKMEIEFINEDNYKAFFMGKHVEGKWDTLKNIDGFFIQTPEGPFQVEILKLTGSEMALRFALGDFLMTRR